MPSSILKISFGRSSSQNYLTALQYAKFLPGYKNNGSGKEERHIIELELKPSTLKICADLLNLLNCIRSWRSAIITINDVKIGGHWDFYHFLKEATQCYERGHELPFLEDYCRGKDSPSEDMKFFGCRFENGVRLTRKIRYHKTEALWHQFGKLSEDINKFFIDKKMIFDTLKAYTSREACVLCPNFSWERMRDAIKQLPDEIDLKSEDFKLRWSDFDPLKPIGIDKVKKFFKGYQVFKGYYDIE